MPDELTGEAIVAVVQQNQEAKTNFEDLRTSVTRALGSSYTPSMILDLANVGHGQFPATVSGKPQKAVLRRWVQEHLEDREQSQRSTASGTLESQLTEIWASVSGQDAANISAESSVHTFADSMMLIQVRSIISDTFRKNVTVRELTDHSSIRSQSELLRQRAEIDPSADGSQPEGSLRQPWRLQAQNEERLSSLQQLGSPQLAAKGLQWAQVEDIFPKPNIIGPMAKGARPNSWNHRHSMLVRNSDERSVTATLETWLRKHALMRSMTTSDEIGEVFLIFPAQDSWLQHQLFNAGSIKRAEDLLVYRFDEPEWDCVNPPGPYLKVTILPIQHTADVGLIFHWHHAIFDGLIIRQWYGELRQLLKKQKPSTAFQPFERYATAVYQRSRNTAAQRAVDYHVNTLRGVSRSRLALWPPQRAPLWLKGNDHGWRYPDGQLGEPGVRVPLDGTNSVGTMGLEYTIEVPHILELRGKYEIPPPIVAKGACVLLNLYLTGGDEVVLATNESGRSWPFVNEQDVVDETDTGDDTGEDIDPLAIDGPTVTLSVSRNGLADKETVVQFLGRLLREQREIEKHSHSSIDGILEQLETPTAGFSASQSKADGQIVRNALNRQIFDWLPDLRSAQTTNPTGDPDIQDNDVTVDASTHGTGESQTDTPREPQPSLEMLEVLSRTDLGFVWYPSLVPGTEVMKLNTTWDDAQLHAAEASKAMKQFLRAARWLSQPENWEWPAKECDFESEDAVIEDCGLASCYRR